MGDFDFAIQLVNKEDYEKKAILVKSVWLLFVAASESWRRPCFINKGQQMEDNLFYFVDRRQFIFVKRKYQTLGRLPHFLAAII